MKKKKINSKNSKKQNAITQNIPQAKKSFRKGIWKIAIIVAAITLFFIVKFGTGGDNNPKTQANKIIRRAKELVQYIPDHKDSIAISEALKKMTIRYPDKNGMINLPPGRNFALVIVSNEQINDQQIVTQLGNDILMEFHGEELEKYGNIVVLMNENIGKLSADIDARATCLIHELVHGLQASRHFSVGEKITPNIVYEDEKMAWNCQVFLYHKVRPDMFEGIKCNCNTLQLYNLNDDQEKVLNPETGDHMVNSLVLYAFCKENFLQRLYK